MQELLTHATIPKNMAFLLLKDSSYPLVLGTKKLVQLQIKVINVLTSSIIIIFTILISLTDFYKNKNYPEYTKTSVKLAFITSIIPIIIFLHLGNETIISNWHWLTIHTTKLSLSLSHSCLYLKKAKMSVVLLFHLFSFFFYKIFR
jgi:hypothetical protein